MCNGASYALLCIKSAFEIYFKLVTGIVVVVVVVIIMYNPKEKYYPSTLVTNTKSVTLLLTAG